MTVLVTGGAGYIGAHVVRLLQQRGDDVVVVDDLSTGDPARLEGVPLHRFALEDPDAVERLTALCRDSRTDAVVHFAARKQVGESVAQPAAYYRSNVGGMAALLLAMETAGVGRLVFSSSAAVYGATDRPLVTEDDPTVPVSPYGETKLVGEWLARDAVRAWGLRAANLRYFNVAGAGWDELGDTAVLNLVPMVFERLELGERPRLFGDDYPTPDGTCVRDYVHVLDLAEAHLAALDFLDRDDRRADTFNIGTGTGTSVAEILTAVGRATGLDVTPAVEARRPGDPPQVVGDVTRAAEVLGWRAAHDTHDVVRSAWSAWRHAHRTASPSPGRTVGPDTTGR